MKNYLFVIVTVCLSLVVVSCSGLLSRVKDNTTLSFSINLDKTTALNTSRAISSMNDGNDKIAVKTIVTLYGRASNKEYVYHTLWGDKILVTIDNVQVGSNIRIGVDIYEIIPDQGEVLFGFGSSEQFTVLAGTNNVTIKTSQALEIKLLLDGGAYEPPPSSTVLVEDGQYCAYIRKGSTLAQNGLANPVRSGYELVGWNTDLALDFTKDTPILENATVSAVWSNGPLVIFNENGGTGTMQSQEIAVGQSAVLSPNVFTKAGYTFKEWNTASDGSGTVCADGATFTMASAINVTLYAQWQSAIMYDETNYGSYTIFEVTSPEHLVQLAGLANATTSPKNFSGKTIVLKNDIDFTAGNGSNFAGIATGSSTLSFRGIFDGGGYTIRNMRIDNDADYVGLIGRTYSATVKDVILGNGCVIKGRSRVGLVGQSSGITISNVSTAAAVSSSGSSGCVGGIVGYIGGTSSAINKIEITTNTGSVSGSLKVGGIAGFATYADIVNCVNKGTVTGTSTLVGGIVGQVENPASSTNKIEKNTNTGSVQGDAQVGGIVGSAIEADIAECINNGTITGRSTLGGIIGDIAGGIGVTASYNTGDIIADSLISGPRSSLGGIVGSTNVPIKKCYNAGNVIVQKGTIGEYLGGIAGKIVNTSSPFGSIQNCYNTGTIGSSAGISLNYVGGIAGNLSTSNSIEHCYNIGVVPSASYTGTTTDGGILGTNATGTLTANYWFQINGKPVNGIGSLAGDTNATPLTLPELADLSKFVGWDTAVWKIANALTPINGCSSRPVLQGVGEGE